MNLKKQLASKSNWFGATLAGIYIVSQISIAVLLGHKVGGALIKMQLSFSQARFNQIVGSWDKGDLNSFQNHFYLDFIHPLWYSLLLAWLLARALPERLSRLVWLPVVAGSCDLLENLIHGIAVFNGTFTSLSQPMIGLASTFAAIKWSLAVICLILFFIHIRTFILSLKQ